jgi:hypothetical protein
LVCPVLDQTVVNAVTPISPATKNSGKHEVARHQEQSRQDAHYAGCPGQHTP